MLFIAYAFYRQGPVLDVMICKFVLTPVTPAYINSRGFLCSSLKPFECVWKGYMQIAGGVKIFMLGVGDKILGKESTDKVTLGLQ